MMKELSEFKEYYEKSLLNTVVVLEEQRKESVSRFFTYTCVASGAAGIIGMLILHFITAPENIYANTSVIVVLVFTILYIYSFVSSEFVDDFKREAIKKIVSFVDESLVYSGNNYVSESDFIQSGIFRRIPDSFSGEDFVSGRVGDVQVEFSEVSARYKREYWAYRRGWYGWGSVREASWYTIFRGLFFTAYINKRFRGRTIVLRDVAESLLGGIGAKIQSLNTGRGQLVKMDDPDFEKFFVVYSDDQIEPRIILNRDLMRKMLVYARKFSRRIYFSFSGSKVYIAIERKRDLLQPRFFRTLLDYGLFQEYFLDLQSLVGIVEGLNLEKIGAEGG